MQYIIHFLVKDQTSAIRDDNFPARHIICRGVIGVNMYKYIYMYIYIYSYILVYVSLCSRYKNRLLNQQYMLIKMITIWDFTAAVF